MIKSIDIENYRGIKELNIDDFSRVNLIVGENASGKSSLLEALYLIANFSEPVVINSIFYNRKHKPKKENDFKSIFFNNESNNDISIAADLDFKNSKEKKRNLEIKFADNNSTFFKFINEKNEEKISAGYILKVQVKKNNNEDISAENEIYFNNESYQTKKNLSINIKNFENIYVDTNDFEFLGKNFYKNVQSQDKTEHLIKILNVIEPNLKNLELGIDNSIECKIESLASPVPLKLMGDGFINIVAFLVAIYTAKDGAVFIDEIENGIYYKVLPDLWKVVFKAAEEFNVQVFATTHSMECLDACNYAFNDSKLNDDFLSLFRLDKNKQNNSISVEHYTSKEFDRSMGYGVDVR